MKTVPDPSGWAGDFDLLPLEDIAGSIVSAAVPKDPQSKAGIAFKHHETTVRINTASLLTAFEREMGGETEGWEVLPAIEWVGKAKKEGFGWLFAGLDMVFSESRDGYGLRLRR